MVVNQFCPLGFVKALIPEVEEGSSVNWDPPETPAEPPAADIPAPDIPETESPLMLWPTPTMIFLYG